MKKCGGEPDMEVLKAMKEQKQYEVTIVWAERQETYAPVSEEQAEELRRVRRGDSGISDPVSWNWVTPLGEAYPWVDKALDVWIRPLSEEEKEQYFEESDCYEVVG